MYLVKIRGTKFKIALNSIIEGKQMHKKKSKGLHKINCVRKELLALGIRI